MKNYFIANGEVLNTNMSAEEIELRVQESLENTPLEWHSSGSRRSARRRSECSLSGTSTMIPINQLSTIRIWP